jgi:hypothetical protein
MNKTQIQTLAALTAEQFGLVSIEQARQHGISDAQLRAAVDRGWFERYRRGVLISTGCPRVELQALMGAQLAAGPRAVVSYASAGVIRGFAGVMAPTIELSTPVDDRVRLSGVRCHRTATLLRSDVESVRGLRVTSAVRTLIDLAPRLHPQLLAEVLDEGTIARLWTPAGVAARVQQLSEGRAVAPLRELLALRLEEGNFRSRFEQRVCRVLRPAVAPFEVNYTIVLDGVPIELDIAWLDCRVDGEVDGYAVRTGSRTKFRRQTRRENLLMAHGWRIVHFTYEMNDETIVNEALRFVPGRLAARGVGLN